MKKEKTDVRLEFEETEIEDRDEILSPELERKINNFKFWSQRRFSQLVEEEIKMRGIA